MGKPDWKDIISSVAPALAAALGGPLAGVAVKVIAGKVLGKEDATEEEVQQAVLMASPDTLLKLKQAEYDFRRVLLESEVKLEQVAAEDRGSARVREINSHDSWTPRVLATVIIGGFLWCVYAVLGGHIQDIKDPLVTGLIGTMIGYTSAKADQVVSYYFGSSASSKAKDQTISDIAKME